MITREAARRIVEREVNKAARSTIGDRLYVHDVDTIERPWGWVMYYGALGRPVAQPPYLVNRVTGELVAAGSAWPIEKYIEDYETRLMATQSATERS